jgi:hypothetical protein
MVQAFLVTSADFTGKSYYFISGRIARRRALLPIREKFVFIRG